MVPVIIEFYPLSEILYINYLKSHVKGRSEYYCTDCKFIFLIPTACMVPVITEVEYFELNISYITKTY